MNKLFGKSIKLTVEEHETLGKLVHKNPETAFDILSRLANSIGLCLTIAELPPEWGGKQ